MNWIKKLYVKVFNEPTLDTSELITDCQAVITEATNIYSMAYNEEASPETLDGYAKSLLSLEQCLFAKYKSKCISDRDFDDFALAWMTAVTGYVDNCPNDWLQVNYGPRSANLVTCVIGGTPKAQEEPADER